MITLTFCHSTDANSFQSASESWSMCLRAAWLHHLGIILYVCHAAPNRLSAKSVVCRIPQQSSSNWSHTSHYSFTSHTCTNTNTHTHTHTHTPQDMQSNTFRYRVSLFHISIRFFLNATLILLAVWITLRLDIPCLCIDWHEYRLMCLFPHR